MEKHMVEIVLKRRKKVGGEKLDLFEENSG